MDFRISDEQRLLRDTARKVLAEATGTSGDDAWMPFRELGWTALPIDEAHDGLGGSLVDLAFLLEELGRARCQVPYLECCVLPAMLLKALASRGVAHAELLGSLARGEQRLGVAVEERSSAESVGAFSTRLAATPSGFRLIGEKLLVVGGAACDGLLVVAVADHETCLVYVPPDAAGVRIRGYSAVDGRELADIEFVDVPVSESAVLARGTAVDEALVEAQAIALTLQCADIVGAMEASMEMTAEYLQQRQQFGQKLASFQALQHGMAVLFIACNEARSMLFRALSALGQADISLRRRAASGCKVKVAACARQVTGMAVQYHGALGMTTEYAVGHYLRRSIVAEQLFGNAHYHLAMCLADHAAVAK